MNGWPEYRKMFLAGIGTIVTGVLAAGLIGIISNFRTVDRLETHFAILTTRDEKQTQVILENYETIAGIQERQRVADHTLQAINVRIEAMERLYGELMERVRRLESERGR